MILFLFFVINGIFDSTNLPNFQIKHGIYVGICWGSSNTCVVSKSSECARIRYVTSHWNKKAYFDDVHVKEFGRKE